MRAHMVTFVTAATLNVIACILLILQKVYDPTKTDAGLEIAGRTLVIINFVVVSIS